MTNRWHVERAWLTNRGRGRADKIIVAQIAGERGIPHLTVVRHIPGANFKLLHISTQRRSLCDLG